MWRLAKVDLRDGLQLSDTSHLYDYLSTEEVGLCSTAADDL